MDARGRFSLLENLGVGLHYPDLCSMYKLLTLIEREMVEPGDLVKDLEDGAEVHDGKPSSNRLLILH